MRSRSSSTLQGVHMSTRTRLSLTALVVAGTVVIAACSPDTPTDPPMGPQSLKAEPTIGFGPMRFDLCYPARRSCPSGGELSVVNNGGGRLDWTAAKNAPWLKRSPRAGTAPSTVSIRVDGTGIPAGSYDGQIELRATGATNSPQRVVVHFTRR